jgi:hypothetical protein
MKSLGKNVAKAICYCNASPLMLGLGGAQLRGQSVETVWQSNSTKVCTKERSLKSRSSFRRRHLQPTQNLHPPLHSRRNDWPFRSLRKLGQNATRRPQAVRGGARVPRRKGCGHDGQRKSVAHMPTAAPATAALRYGRMIDAEKESRSRGSHRWGPLQKPRRTCLDRLGKVSHHRGLKYSGPPRFCWCACLACSANASRKVELSSESIIDP